MLVCLCTYLSRLCHRELSLLTRWSVLLWVQVVISWPAVFKASFPGNLHLVLVLRPTSFFHRTVTDLGFRFSQEDFMLKMPVRQLILSYQTCPTSSQGTLYWCSKSQLHRQCPVVNTAATHHRPQYEFCPNVSSFQHFLQSISSLKDKLKIFAWHLECVCVLL